MLFRCMLISLIFIHYLSCINAKTSNPNYELIVKDSRIYLNQNSNLLDSVQSKISKNVTFQQLSRKLSKRSSKRMRNFFNSRIGSCQRMDFNVNFVELGWDKWILYPKIFNAHICSGNCQLPLQMKRKSYVSYSSHETSYTSSLVQVTNHAQIMSILEYKHPEINKHMTKCVSTKLKPLTVIFLDEYGQIKTKQYEDMVVQECGCR